MKKINWIRIGAYTLAILMIVSVIGGFTYFKLHYVWNTETGVFVCAEFHPERVLNVTWIRLENMCLKYGTYNPEVMDLIPGETYRFVEGVPSGNYGKRLIRIEHIN